MALAVTLVAPQPAQASVSGSLGDGGAVRYSGCHEWDVPYALDIEPGVDDWDLTLSVKGPDGLEAFSDFLYSSADPESGFARIQVCSIDDPGTYTVEATGSWSDYDADQYGSFELSPSVFTVQLPESRTSIAVAKRPKNRVLIAVRVHDERPNGFFPSDYARVRLQVLHRGRWVTANGGTATTDNHGFARFVYRRSVRTKARALTVDENFERSISKVVIVPGRR